MIKIWYEDECGFRLPDAGKWNLSEEFGDPVKCAEKVAMAVLSHEGFTEEAELSLTVTDADSMRIINREQREIDSTTDVLSFPAFDYSEPAAFSEALDDPFSKDPDSGRLLLGDIVICADRVVSQAEEYGHSEIREYAFLIAHSVLHLIGYDHMTEEEAEVMFQKQELILNGLRLSRTLMAR